MYKKHNSHSELLVFGRSRKEIADMDKTMGMRIRELRKKLGMTQEELAEIIYTKKSVISRYENDNIDIKTSVIMELAKALNTTCGYIVNGEVEAELRSDENELLGVFRGLKSDIMRIALEQMKVLRSLQ